MARLASSLPATLHPTRFLDDVISHAASDATREGVARALGRRAIALVLASAEFQRR
jgi:hypothetical protein